MADNQILYRGVLAQELLHLSPPSASFSHGALPNPAPGGPSVSPSPGRIFNFSSVGSAEQSKRSESSLFSLSPITAGSEKVRICLASK